MSLAGRTREASARAREAGRKALDGAKDARGVTHRHDAMIDPDRGYLIPAVEFSTVDDDVLDAPDDLSDIKVHPEQS